MMQEQPDNTGDAIALLGVPPELRAVSDALDRLGRHEGTRARADLELALFGATAHRIRRPSIRVLTPWLRVAAALALLAGGFAVWSSLRPGSAPAPSTQQLALEQKTADLEREMEAWLSTASWTVADAAAASASTNGLSDFWPPIEDELLYEESM